MGGSEKEVGVGSTGVTKVERELAELIWDLHPSVTPTVFRVSMTQRLLIPDREAVDLGSFKKVGTDIK